MDTYLQNKKLLLMDDEPELLKMVTSILLDEGFVNIVTAISVKEGISVAQKEKPDLAILDVMLPDGDGFSLMQQIRIFSFHRNYCSASMPFYAGAIRKILTK